MMGQTQSAGESTPHGLHRRRKSHLSASSGLRAGIRVPDRCRDGTFTADACQLHSAGAALKLQVEDAPETAASGKRGILGCGDDEDVQFLEALKGLVDGAVKLLGADKGVGTWLMSGLLRKSGMVDSFVDSMVVFVNLRIGALLEALSPKDAACAFARRLRHHARAHDATTAALGIRAGRKKRSRREACCSGRSPAEGAKKVGVSGEEGEEVEEGEEEGEGEESATAGGEDAELEEHDVQPVRLWRQWKLSGGFWPPCLPDPDDPSFDGPDGTKDFLAKLDDGTHSFLREASRSILDTALPEEAEDLRAACEAAAGGGLGGGGGGGSRGGHGDSSRSIMDTANRLSQLKSGVLEPMLCQVLTQQVVGRFCRSARLWQFVLQLVRPGANLNPAVRDMKHPEAFSLMAGALERSSSTPPGTLRMELMQGLVKMAWGTSVSSIRQEGSEPPPRGMCRPSVWAAGPQPVRDNAGDTRPVAATPERQPSAAKMDDCKSRIRSYSVNSVRSQWSAAESGFDSADGDGDVKGGGVGCGGGALPSATPRGRAMGGARDIFNIPYTEQLSHGLVGGEKDKFYDDLEEYALGELARFLQTEIVDKVPFGSVLLADTWIPDRVKAARAFARRPTNLMLVLSVIDASKAVIGAAGDKDKAETSQAAAADDDASAADMSASIGAPGGGGASAVDLNGRESGAVDVPAQTAQARPDNGDAEVGVYTPSGKWRLWRRRGQRQLGSVRRDTPGRRVWEARRSCFFGMDLGVAKLHVGRSLLGQEALELGNAILKSTSLDYCSVEAVIRDEAAKTFRKCSDTAAPDLVRRVKPLSTEPILYISSQMRMLRALKKTGLDFSKSFGEGPQKKALSRRFKSYSWIFTDALIDKLVALKVADAARFRAAGMMPTIAEESLKSERGRDQTGGDFAVMEGEFHPGEARTADMRPRWKELKQERRACKIGVMVEMTAGCPTSKELLAKVVDSWLPEVLAADRAAEGRFV